MQNFSITTHSAAAVLISIISFATTQTHTQKMAKFYFHFDFIFHFECALICKENFIMKTFNIKNSYIYDVTFFLFLCFTTTAIAAAATVHFHLLFCARVEKETKFCI
jgi:hypothetical protein